MQSYLADLLARLTAKESDVTDSNDSVSWHAHREAEKLGELSFVEELDNFLESKRSQAERRAAYFIIGAIGNNTGEPECARILVGRARTETDKYALSSLLDSLAGIRKPGQVDLEPVFSLLNDKRWLVRHAAIQSLRNAASAEPEDRLLALLATTSDPFDIIYCQATLNDIGTSKSLPALRANLGSRKRDVKDSAASAIEAIEARATGMPASAK